MVCDGLPMGLAFRRAGFTSKHSNAPSNLFHLPRVQERAAAILEARRTQGVVSLPEVTDMLKRVFAGAHSEGEYSAAHNAAFSLARLYGHVTDKSTVEIIRRPSRDPDAPSEQALTDWAAGLPVVGASGPQMALEVGQTPQKAASGPAPAALLGPGPQVVSRETIEAPPPMLSADNIEGPGPELYAYNWGLSNDINGLAEGPGPGGRGETGNGAPWNPVTGAPQPGARSGLLGPGPHPPEQKEVDGTNRVPFPTGEWPKIEDLF
jgi:hypothetical protein